MINNLYVAIHNVTGIQKIKEFTQLLTGFQIKNIIISKAVGSAAMSGVPQAQKLVFKKGGNLLYLEDIPDCIELLVPDEVYLFAPYPYSKNLFLPETIASKLKNDKKILLIFGGSDPGLSKRELEFGIASYIELPADIGTIGTAAIILYQIFKKLQ
ncbi:MAG: RecB-family nuclease [Candidatus Helarchaeota archaeon]